MATLLIKFTNEGQYNPSTSTITYEDGTPSRWSSVYSKLKTGDTCIFHSDSNILYIGEYQSSILNTSVTFGNIKKTNIKLDDLLRIHLLQPETISVFKRPPGPILKDDIDVNLIFQDVRNEKFVSFYAIKKGKESLYLPKFAENDRVVLIDESGRISDLCIVENGALKSASIGDDLFKTKGKYLNEILNIHKAIQNDRGSKSSNNVRSIERLIDNISKDGFYQFRSFSEYYNAIHNKSAYNPQLPAGGDSDNAELSDDFFLEDESDVKYSLNSILYGPPGTGKTYTLKSLFDRYTTNVKSQTREQFERALVDDLAWWEVAALCLYDLKKAKVPELLKHPLVIAKFAQSDIKHHSERLWSTLQNHTVENCENVGLALEKRHGVAIFFKDTNKTWRLDNIQEFEEQFSELIVIFHTYKQGPESGKALKRYIFTTFHQSIAYEDFIEGIKPKMAEDDASEMPGQLGYAIEKGIFAQACEEAARLAGYQNLRECLEDTKESRKQKFESIKGTHDKQFCLFIDEINRANISAVFGELITLIEEDKRLGAEQEIIVDKLPYSKKTFGVPPNLYIMGTMNTADRSVEALDTALRRRFSFVKMEPKPKELPHKVIEEIDLVKMLETINERLEVLIDADHTIGHAWLWDVKDLDGLRKVFADKILPLLQEFFYNDYEKIGLVLGPKFVTAEKRGNILAKFNGGTGLGSEYQDRYLFKIISPGPDNWNSEAFISIYSTNGSKE